MVELVDNVYAVT